MTSHASDPHRNASPLIISIAWPVRGNVARLQIEEAGDRLSIMERSEHRPHLVHLSKHAPGTVLTKIDWDLPHLQVEYDFRDILAPGRAAFASRQLEVAQDHRIRGRTLPALVGRHVMELAKGVFCPPP